MSNSESRPTTTADEISMSSVVVTTTGDGPARPKILTPRRGGLQIAVNADITLFMSVEDWRALNTAVEKHVAEHLTEQVSA